MFTLISSGLEVLMFPRLLLGIGSRNGKNLASYMISYVLKLVLQTYFYENAFPRTQIPFIEH